MPKVSFHPKDARADQDDRSWYVPATDRMNDANASADGKPMNVILQFRVPSNVKRVIHKIVYSGKFPAYEDPSDMLRHALDRHLTWIQAQPEAPKTVIGQIRVMQGIVREEQFQQEIVVPLMEAATHRYEGAAKANNVEAAERMLVDLWAAVEDMPDGSWRRWAEEQFQKRFPQFSTGG